MAYRGKLKTHKGAKRRFRYTASGKLVQAKGMKSHLRRNKSTRVKQQFDKLQDMHPTNAKRVRRMLPHGN